MSKRKRKKGAVYRLAALLILAGAGVAAWRFYAKEETVSTETAANAYREETVKSGAVISGITESGTVAFGTLEQEFSVAEVTEVSSDSSSSSASQSAGEGAMGGMNGSSSSSASSGTDTSLEVEEVYVAVGQSVEVGDALLKITDDSIADYRAQLEAAVTSAGLQVQQEEINVESKRTEADYTYKMYIAEGETALETYEATIINLENDVEDLEEELAEALEELETVQAEYDAGYDVEEELEEAELAYSTAEANLQIAKNNLTTQSIEAKQIYEKAMTNYQYADQLYAIDTDGLEDDLDEAKAVLEEEKSALSEFEEQIGDGIIYAEYAGTVMELACSEGDTLASDTVIATFSDSDNITMTVAVSQDDIANITVGDEVSITLSAYDNETFSAEVASISTSSTMGSSTVNYDVESRFTGDIQKVYAGMTGEVTFVVKQAEDVLYISNRAVYQDGADSFVKVLQEDGSIENTVIETGFSNGTYVEVVSGLEEGQTVLVESQVSQ